MYAEDKYDYQALVTLAGAICPAIRTRTKFRKKPLLLRRGVSHFNDQQPRAMKAALRAEQLAGPVLCVLVHEDCDDVEPSHESRATRIEEGLRPAFNCLHAITPAWELEAWWFLWPTVLESYRAGWSMPSRYRGRAVGMITNAKETLKRALVSGSRRKSVATYCEADAPGIAAAVVGAGFLAAVQGTSGSFDRFVESMQECCLCTKAREMQD